MPDASARGTDFVNPTPHGPNGRERWFAAGGALAALVASTCCVVPLLLVLAGISGAWIGSLTVLEPYRWYFMVVAALFIGLGFWRVYVRPKPDCTEGSYCTRPQSSKITKGALWVGLVLIIINATMDWWAPLFY